MQEASRRCVTSTYRRWFSPCGTRHAPLSPSKAMRQVGLQRWFVFSNEPLIANRKSRPNQSLTRTRYILRIRRNSQALDAVDSMAFSAMRFCELSDSNPNRGEGNLPLVAALVAGGSSIGGLESEIRIPNGDKVQRTKLAWTAPSENVLQACCAHHSRCCCCL